MTSIAITSDETRPITAAAEALRTVQPDGWPTPRGYANGMIAQGRVLVTGGVIGWDEAGVFPEGFVAQARATFANICTILAAGGGEPRHLVRLTWYVVDMDEYVASLKDLGRAYRDTIGAHYPTMAVVGVTRLVEPAARIEIEATAILPADESRG